MYIPWRKYGKIINLNFVSHIFILLEIKWGVPVGEQNEYLQTNIEEIMIAKTSDLKF